MSDYVHCPRRVICAATCAIVSNTLSTLTIVCRFDYENAAAVKDHYRKKVLNPKPAVRSSHDHTYVNAGPPKDDEFC